MRKTKLPELDPNKTALELHRSGFKVIDYINGIQSDRKRRLETFKKFKIPYLIEQEEKLIAYGENVILRMKALNLLKFFYNEKRTDYLLGRCKKTGEFKSENGLDL